MAGLNHVEIEEVIAHHQQGARPGRQHPGDRACDEGDPQPVGSGARAASRREDRRRRARRTCSTTRAWSKPISAGGARERARQPGARIRSGRRRTARVADLGAGYGEMPVLHRRSLRSSSGRDRRRWSAATAPARRRCCARCRASSRAPARIALRRPRLDADCRRTRCSTSGWCRCPRAASCSTA